MNKKPKKIVKGKVILKNISAPTTILPDEIKCHECKIMKPKKDYYHNNHRVCKECTKARDKERKDKKKAEEERYRNFLHW